jgi:integrase
MVDFMLAPAVVNPVFCVPKPDSSLRFLINAKRANKFFSQPPNPDLPSPDLISALLPPATGRLFAAKVDLECFYFFMALPEWLVPFFGLPSVRAADVSPALASRFGPDAVVFPCFNRLPMGWSHSVYLAQQAHLHLLLRGGVLSEADRISVENDLRLDRVRWLIYIDDFCIIGLDPLVMRRLQDAYLAAIRSLGFVAKPSKLVPPTSDAVSLLGLEFVGSARTFGLGADKLSTLRTDTCRLLSSRFASGDQLASIVGRWSWALLVRRPCFAVLSSVFSFIRAAGSSLFSVWRSVRRELVLLLGLAPLLCVRLSADIFPVAVAVDASSSGAGAVALQSSSSLLAPLASRVAARCDLAALPPAGGADLLAELHSDSRVHSSSPSPMHLSTPVQLLLSSPSRVVASFPWSSSPGSQEHINSLELRTALLGLRKIVSASSAISSTCLLLTDSAVSFFALRKGRSSSHQLLRRVRPISALLLSCGIRLCPVWLPSASNPADLPSRCWSLSSRQRNKLAHITHGNTSSSPFVLTLSSECKNSGISPLLPVSTISSSRSRQIISPSDHILARPLPSSLTKSFSFPLPPLRKASVASSTLNNYLNQLRFFFAWLACNNINPSSQRDIDYAFEAFLHSFFSARDGKGLAIARNALYGLFLVFPHLRSTMPLSRRAIKGWEKLCPSVSHPPLSWELTCLVAVRVLSSSPDFLVGLSCAVAILVAWEAYLRVGEVCALCINDILFRDVGSVFKTSLSVVGARSHPAAQKRLKQFTTQPVLVSLRLVSTKTGPNQWAQIRSPFVAFLLHHFLLVRTALGLPSSSSSSVFHLSTELFRKEMTRACSSINLAPEFTPHSLRHGHATADYEAGATVQDIAIRGRWRTLDSLLIYVQSGPALAVKFCPSSSVASVASSVAANLLSVLSEVIRRRVSK